MESKKVIAGKNLPTRSPLPATVIYITALHYWNAPQWLYGVVGVLLLLMWGNFIYSVITKQEIDITELLSAGLDNHQYDFTKGGYTGSEKKSQFRDMLDQQLADAKAQREDLENKKNK